MFQFKKNKKVNIFSKTDGEEDDDDDELFSGAKSSDKLASLFNDDSPSKHPQTLKYVAPKQPVNYSSVNQPSLQQENAAAASRDTSSEVLYATDGKLFSYKNSEVFNIGPVMCCIIQVRIKNSFTLLIYKIRTNIISRTEITENFNLLVQKDNYVTFTDDSKSQWTLHIDGIHYEEFVTQIGICKACSSFTTSAPSSEVVTQRLSEGVGDYLLKVGDKLDVSLCAWQVENWKKGKTITNRETMRLRIETKPSWHAGLINCKLHERCLIFFQDSEAGNISPKVYDVMIKSLSSQNNDFSLPEITSIRQENTNSKKASLISRMAKVGQPLLPASPRHVPTNRSSLPTDSESEEERVQRRLHGHKNINNTRSSTSSSVEEINLANKEYNNKVGDVSADSLGHNQDFLTTVDHHFNQHSNIPLGQGALIAYHPPSLLQQQQQQLQNLQRELDLLKQQKESSKSQSSESLLSLLFSESRTQNTDLRVALSQLTQKVDLVYDKMNTVGPNTHYPISNATEQLFQTSTKPRELLGQITDLVEQVEKYKHQMAEKNTRIEELTKDYTMILKKNQMLLEEKSELINLTREKMETESQNKIQVQELISVQEEKIKIQNNLDLTKEEINKLNEEMSTLKSDHVDLGNKFDDLRRKDAENSALFVDLKTENRNLKKDVDGSTKIIEIFEETSKKNEEILRKTMEENENFKERIRLLEEKLELELKLKNDLELELRRDLELELKSKRNLELDLQNKQDLELKLKSDLESELMSKRNLELELRRDMELELKLKKDLELELKYKNEEISNLATENSNLLKKQINTVLSSTGTNTDPVSSSSSKPSAGDLETLGKEIMNSAYKKLKKVFSPEESYAKQVILENVIMAFRETISDYTDRSKETIEEQNPSTDQNPRTILIQTENGHTLTKEGSPNDYDASQVSSVPSKTSSGYLNTTNEVLSDVPKVSSDSSKTSSGYLNTTNEVLSDVSIHAVPSNTTTDHIPSDSSIVCTSPKLSTSDVLLNATSDDSAVFIPCEISTTVQEEEHESEPIIKDSTIVLSAEVSSKNTVPYGASSVVQDRYLNSKSEENVNIISDIIPSSLSVEHSSSLSPEMHSSSPPASSSPEMHSSSPPEIQSSSPPVIQSSSPPEIQSSPSPEHSSSPPEIYSSSPPEIQLSSPPEIHSSSPPEIQSPKTSEKHPTEGGVASISSGGETVASSVPSTGGVSLAQVDEDEDKTWKTGPPPPPPPLFSESEDDDDWLS